MIRDLSHVIGAYEVDCETEMGSIEELPPDRENLHAAMLAVMRDVIGDPADQVLDIPGMRQFLCGCEDRSWYREARALMAYPIAGDAVRATADRMIGVDAGEIGIIGGFEGSPIKRASITWKYRAFRDGHSVNVSGGPATIATKMSELTWTGEFMDIRFWKWKDGVSGAGRGEEYKAEVAVWEW